MIKIDINLVFTIINLIVLYLLMKKFLFGPIIGVMEKRKAMIDEQFASAEKTTTEANQLKGQYEDALKSAKEESFSHVGFFLCYRTNAISTKSYSLSLASWN